MKQKLNDKGLTEAEYLQAFDINEYERPAVTVDILLLRMKENLSCMQTLLIKRKEHPFLDYWSLPGGFLDSKESAYDSACRVLKEKTGIDGIYLEQLYTMNQPERDPRMRVIDVSYIGLIPYADRANAKENASDDTAWFDISYTKQGITLSNSDHSERITYTLEERIFPNGIISVKNYVPKIASESALAFDHSEIVLEGLSKLRNKVLLSDTAFNLVPAEFTLPDLQKVYEVILGIELYKANFRDKMANKIVSMDRREKPISGNRIAAVYKYKKD